MILEIPPNNSKAKAKALTAAAVLTLLICAPEIESSDSCKNCDCVQECFSGVFNQTSCPIGTYYREKVTVGGCCPGCVKFRSLDEECDGEDSEGQTYKGVITEENGEYVSSDCAPGLSCQQDMTTSEYSCKLDNAKCFSYLYQDDVLWIPSCEPDDTFSPVQKKGDFLSGRWFCYGQDGKRIFGQAWRSNPVDMTCACSREAIEAGERSDVSLHCNDWGNYESLQCDDGLCWCSDTKTGLPHSVAVPTEMSTLLPCYMKAEIGSQYLRECESSAVAAGKIKDILIKHGTNYTNMEVEICDPDGSYGSYQIVKDRITCTWKDESAIGGYACPVDQLSTVNCNCARDTKLFEASDLPFHLTCAGNGNYNPKQISEKKSFCVDSDGYPTTNLLDEVDCPAV